jgi:beta-glucosidase/6-phospho-beta-glucosidase/beta-galactosidase
MTGAPLGWHQDGRLHFALGIEDTFVPQSAPGERPIDEYELTDHYRQWHGDLDRVKASGATLLRWGVPWYRANPQPGVFDWNWIDRVIDRQVELGIEPIVDLLHYGTPLWLDQQFANPDFPDRFAEFAVRFAERFGDAVTSYTPVNEPMIHAQFAGEYAYWPPYLHGQAGLNQITAAVAVAASRAQRGIRETLGERAVFVHVDAGFRYVGATEAGEHRDQVARMLDQRYLAEDLLTGRVRDGHPLLNDLLSSGVPEGLLAELADTPAPPDVMGVNYYPLHSTEMFEAGVHHRGGFADPRPARDDGTAGLVEVLTEYERRYDVPVMLTETCVTGPVEQRIAWLDASVEAVDRMRDDGRRVVGYTWWPLFDMYEWTWRHSTGPRGDFLLTMGLYDLVESPGGLTRRKNAVADRFRTHALQHEAQPALEAATLQED